MPDTAPAPVPQRRWPRRVLAALAVLAALLGAGFWLLGRESTLQALVQKIASASGGQVTVSGVSGSLYGRMHLGHVRYRGKQSEITADELDINWSPLQYFSQGIAISELRVASLTVASIGPATPATLPATLAPPFRLSVADARVARLTVQDAAGASTEFSALRLALSADAGSWQLRAAQAATPWGQLTAEASVGASRPFAVDARASLQQSAAPAGQAPAQVTAQAHGNLGQLELAAQGSAGAASGDAKLTLAPFEPVILRALQLNGRGIDPASFHPAWPQAKLRLTLAATLDAGQNLAGTLALNNAGQAGPLDQQRLPLRAVSARLGGKLDAAAIEAVLIDLGAAGSFHGAGSIAHGAGGAGSAGGTALGKASFTLHTAGIDLKAIHGSLHSSRIAGDIHLDSDGKTHTARALLAQDGLRLDLLASLDDALLQLKQARLQAGKGSIVLSGQASLKDRQAFKASASIAHFDPASLGDYPAADLNADIGLNGNLAPAWTVTADAALRPSRLFQQPLSGNLRLTADARHIGGVQASLALGRNTAGLRGDFGAPGERLSWRLDAGDLSAAQAGLRGALAAQGVIEGSMAAPRSSFTADASGLGLAAAAHPAPAGAVHASGAVTLAEPGRAGPQREAEFNLSGTAARIDPAAFGPYPAGSINAGFKGAGKLARDWRATLELALQPSTLAGAPLSGHARLTADPARIDGADLDLHLGANSVQARGSFGTARDKLAWTLEAPQLATLGPQFGGALRGNGSLSGGPAMPSLSLTLDGRELRWNQQRIRGVRASASLGSGQGGADPLQSDIELSAYSSPGFTLAGARLQTTGTRAAHTLQLAARNDDFDAALQLHGTWNAGLWSGMLDTLQNRGRYALALQAPAPLRLSLPAGAGVAGLLHPEQIALAEAVFRLGGGSLNVQSLEKNGAQWRSSGSATGVPLNYLAQLAPAWRDNAGGDLTLGAQWSFAVQAGAARREPALNGMLHVYREKGDLTVGADLPLALGLRTLDARADVANGMLRVQAQLDGTRAGQARLNGSVQLLHGRIANDSALSLTGSADMASLAWLTPLAGQPGLELDGALKLAIAGAGSVAAPQLSGDIAGQRLTLNWAGQGLKLRNGQLQAKLAGDQLQLQRLSFDGGEGHALADGWIRFSNAEASMQLKLVADKLEVLSRPDRILVVSGQSTLLRDEKRFRLEGKFKAERAAIEMAAQDTPTLSDDVVVLGKGGLPNRPAAPTLPLNIDLEADLGEAFYLKGKGLDAQLAGSVHIRVQDRRPPRANGSIRVVSGTYAAYGQKLSIERGLLNFTGAYDNPGLNLLAVRKRPEGETLSESNVEAGVEVRGTALAPTAKLVSTPSVPDSEKLAWLVLGHGTEGTAGDELGLLSTAAGALFGGTGGGLQARLASTLGVDELGVSKTKGLETTVVTVGKRLSQRAYLSFEQGASTATSVVKLRYKLNPRVTLQFQTGTNSALDVLYTWAFD